jgi:hypothetical protein
MKSIPIVVIIFFLLNTISCDNNDRKVKEIVKVSADTLMVAPKIDTVKHFPSLIAFEQSNCRDVNEKGEKILSKKLYSDTLSIKITSVQDCGTKYDGDFKFAGDTLNLIIKQAPIIIKRKNGRIDTIYESQDCYCLYKFSFKIKSIESIPKTIILNGRKFRGEWKGL